MPSLLATSQLLPPAEEALAELLRLRLTWLRYQPFEHCVALCLAECGFRDLERGWRTAYRGRTPIGGVDMEAVVASASGDQHVLIQIKAYRRVVSRRFIDELRSTMLRFDAPMGMLITTSTFSKVAKRAAAAFPGRPIRLLEGHDLGRLMVLCRVGVIERFDFGSRQKRLVLDSDWFEDLERHYETLSTRRGTQRKGAA